jgi:hypothetical protein
MSSLFSNKRRSSLDLVMLPACCVPAATESDALRSKREAQLKWMREKGVRYLIDNPIPRPAPSPRPARTQPLPAAKVSLTALRPVQTH